MPTVDRIDGLRVVIWPNDHRPAHVHVIGAGGEAVFDLRCADGPPELREVYGFRLAEVMKIERELARRLVRLCKEWSRFHGDY